MTSLVELIIVGLFGVFALFVVVWYIASHLQRHPGQRRFFLVVSDYMDGCAARGMTDLGGDWEATKREMQKKQGRRFGTDGRPLDDMGWR